MESNKFYYYFFKFGLLGVALLILIIPIMSYISPDSVTINGETGKADTFTILVFGLIALILILLFFAIKDKFVIVELGNQTLKISHNGEVKTVSWLDVEQIRQIQFVAPPLYKLKLKGSEDFLWFNTEPHYLSVNGFATDLSEMGDLIKKKKRELGI